MEHRLLLSNIDYYRVNIILVCTQERWLIFIRFVVIWIETRPEFSARTQT